MSLPKYYVKDTDIVHAETLYRVVKWVHEDPDRAVEVGSTLVAWGLAILGIACVASALKDESTTWG